MSSSSSDSIGPGQDYGFEGMSLGASRRSPPVREGLRETHATDRKLLSRQAPPVREGLRQTRTNMNGFTSSTYHLETNEFATGGSGGNTGVFDNKPKTPKSRVGTPGSAYITSNQGPISVNPRRRQLDSQSTNSSSSTIYNAERLDKLATIGAVYGHPSAHQSWWYL